MLLLRDNKNISNTQWIVLFRELRNVKCVECKIKKECPIYIVFPFHSLNYIEEEFTESVCGDCFNIDKFRQYNYKLVGPLEECLEYALTVG